jgi:hypothetical protein
MKAKLFLFYPWLFGLLAVFTYFLAYSHSWGSNDATTMFLVFSAAITWSSLIFIKAGRKHLLLKIYIISSLIFSAIYIEFIRITPVDPALHRIAWGLIVLALFLLNILLNLFYRSKT